ncbi:MAG TPA: pitrilysin family protein, partial [Polyangiaceae bacterium]|nr:pitrilysin family protein [Polyangiaceae bacterium]
MKKLVWLLFWGCLVACSAPPAPRAAAASAKPAPRAAPADLEPWRKQRPAPGAPAELAYPAPEVVRLPNGLTLYVLQRKAGIAELLLVVRHGQSSVPEGKSGLAALTARMLSEGTRAKTTLALAEAVESLGTTLETDAGRDHSSVALQTLPRDLGQGLALLAEVVQAPRFDAKDFARVKNEWLDGLIAERQQPQRLASLVALRLLLGMSQGAPVSGSVPDVKSLNVPDLRDFHRRYYTPADSALILVGDFTLADVKAPVEKSLGTWRGHAAQPSPTPKAPAPAPGKRLVLVDRSDAVQTALFSIQVFPKRNVAGHEARQVLSNLLGGLFTSRINQNLREKHAFTYGARSTLMATRAWGAFSVATSVRTDVTGAALEQLGLELAGIANNSKPIKPPELSRSKIDLINALGAHLEHTGHIAEDLAQSFVQSLPTDYVSRYAPL